jgi:type VI secretion system protein ImpK
MDISTQYNDLLFDSVEQINNDRDYWFQLRGDNSNRLIDAATPLFGLSLRVRTLTHCDNIEQIYKQTIDEIKAIEIELTEQGFEHAILMAYRYILCAFLDEAVMGTSWGSSSVWAEHSMLSRFHNETWGGEKVYSILSRLEGEPDKYHPLLEFIHSCLILGFEGKYRVIENGRNERERVIARLRDTLDALNGNRIEPLTQANNHVVKTKYRLNRQWPIWAVLLCFILALGGAYATYTWLLHEKSADVINQLNQLL